MKLSHIHGYLAVILQIVFFVLFCIFVRYHPDAHARYHPLVNETDEEHYLKKYSSGDENVHAKTYPMFVDVHAMIFIGFGFLMMFLKKYGFSAVGLNFMVGVLSLQWAILINGFFHLSSQGTILVDLNSLLGADFVAAAVLISFGAMIGKVTPTQLILLTLIEIPIFAINEVIGRRYFHAIDMGDSMFVHTFGAYFGLACSIMLFRRDASTDKEGADPTSDRLAMVGTIFLWIFWPSFNAGAAPGDDQHRGIINTYLSLTTCCFISFAISSILHKEKKFDMVHIQNSTLAGGVAIGTAADLMIHPWGAALVGMIAGVISVLGYFYLTPFMSSRLRLHDTCGVNNLHGMPGILAGIIGSIMAAVASEASYGPSLYQIFPARAPMEGTAELARLRVALPDLEAGLGITAAGQATNQILALVITMGISIVGGLVTGLILRARPFNSLKTEELYSDEKYWLMEEGEEEEEVHKGNVVFPMVDNGTNNERIVMGGLLS